CWWLCIRPGPRRMLRGSSSLFFQLEISGAEGGPQPVLSLAGPFDTLKQPGLRGPESGSVDIAGLYRRLDMCVFIRIGDEDRDVTGVAVDVLVSGDARDQI